jgi:hypothetical protein
LDDLNPAAPRDDEQAIAMTNEAGRISPWSKTMGCSAGDLPIAAREPAQRGLLLDPTAAGEPANSMRKLAGINDQMFGAK